MLKQNEHLASYRKAMSVANKKKMAGYDFKVGLIISITVDACCSML